MEEPVIHHECQKVMEYLIMDGEQWSDQTERSESRCVNKPLCARLIILIHFPFLDSSEDLSLEQRCLKNTNTDLSQTPDPF